MGEFDKRTILEIGHQYLTRSYSVHICHLFVAYNMMV